ncbi:MAG: hypothetical protein U0325_02875 [Polyangiales bacterium]
MQQRLPDAGQRHSARVLGRCENTCRPGFGECDGNDANGCESNLATSTSHCGGCGRPGHAQRRAGVRREQLLHRQLHDGLR